MTSVRHHLREATAAAHARVDYAFSRFELAKPGHYRAFLDVHAAVVPTCEQIVLASQISQQIKDWNDRLRTPSLVADRSMLGQFPVLPPVAVQPVSLAAAFGMAYVLEGSRLGGVVLAKRVEGNSDPLCRSATRYLLHGQGRRFWPTFLEALESMPGVSAALPIAISSALHTFDRFAEAAAHGLTNVLDRQHGG